MMTLNTRTGEIQQEIVGNSAVRCSRYVGKFHQPGLKSKAETGCWYSKITGNPHAIEGEGMTPEDAVRDSILRTESRIKEMQAAVNTMYTALASVEKY
jgi:hypothetical protein